MLFITAVAAFLPLALTLPAVAAPTKAQPGHQKGLAFNFPDTTSPRRFEIRVDKGLLQQTQRKIRDYRPSPNYIEEWSIGGPPTATVAGLADYWLKEYSWRATEKELNEYNHFATTVPGNGNYSAPIPLHFVHEKATDKDAIPLLLIHGWSSTHHEWSKVIKGLTTGADGTKSYHVVAPDLPGYGFTPSANGPGLGPREVGRAFDAMMKQLGYEEYVIVSTDIGWLVGMWMTSDVRKSLLGHFTDFYLINPTTDDLDRLAQNQTTQEEADYITSAVEWSSKHFSYATVQTQRPQALSLAMGDSPVGFAGWLWDLKYSSSDGYQYTYDELITETMLMWVQEPVGTIQAYADFVQPHLLAIPRTDVPTGVTQWGNLNGPFEAIAKYPLVPQPWVEAAANVVFFRRHEIGGHFPAVCQPDLWVADVKDFLSGL